MKELLLARGLRVKLDDQDYLWARHFSWQWSKIRHNIYVYHRFRPEPYKVANIYLHRVVAGARKGDFVDHINFDTLDNRRANLRICTNSQNSSKKPERFRAHKNRHGYRGVSLYRNGRFRAQLYVNGNYVHGGFHDTAEAAARAYDAVAKVKFGEYATLNFPDN